MSSLRCFGRRIGALSFGLIGVSSQSNSASLIRLTRLSYKHSPGLTIRPFSITEQPSLQSDSDDKVSNLFKDVDYQEIVGNNEELLKKLKIIMLEIEVMRQDGSKVPDYINTVRWKEILDCKSRSQRIKLLSFLYITEKKKQNDLKKKEIRRKEGELRKQEVRCERSAAERLHYGVGGNTFLLRIYDSKIDHFHNQNLIRAMLHGQKIVLDLSYDVHMTPKESGNCAKQLIALFAENRCDDDPYNIYFCNANPESLLIKKLISLNPRLYDPDFPINITEKSYLDLFPKEKLVYLTPHCREELLEYSHDDIYIIGAMVDKTNNDPLSLGKAKKEGLRMAKFPLDRHLSWFRGTKSLTVNQSLAIMLSMKVTNDWKKALLHVPRRKVLQPYQLEDRPLPWRNPYRSLNRFA